MRTHPERTTRGAALAAAGIAAVLVAGVALASGGEMDTGEALSKVAVHAVNFVLYIALLVYVGRRPLRDFLANRRLAIRKDLDESQNLKQDAERRYGDIEQRLVGFDDEIREMLDRVRKECARESRRAIEAAHEAADLMENTANRNVSEEAEKARHELRAETVELAVGLAREVLLKSIADGDQRRLTDTYLERLSEER